MALKDLVVKRKRRERPSPANVIIQTLKRFGVSAPVTTAAAITADLNKQNYGFRTYPRHLMKPLALLCILLLPLPAHAEKPTLLEEQINAAATSTIAGGQNPTLEKRVKDLEERVQRLERSQPVTFKGLRGRQ